MPPPPKPPRNRRWGRASAISVAALVVVGAGVGVGMAVGSKPAADAMDMGSHSTDKPATGENATGTKGGSESGKQTKKKKADAKPADPAKQAWAHKYGLDRSTMPNLAPAATASQQQQAAATDLLVRTKAATVQYSDIDKAKAAGYDLLAKVKEAQQKKPGLVKAMQKIDADGPPADGSMPMMHVGNKSAKSDGKVLDPSAPETLMYGYEGDGHWMLMGVMYTATESYPQAPPDPGGPITRWHYHSKSGGQNLMMHIFFVPGNDLAHAYAADLKG
jgi:hypothetical protein